MLVTEFYEEQLLNQYGDIKAIALDDSIDFMVGDIESSLDDSNQWVFELIVITDGYNLYEFKDITECIEWLMDCETTKLYFHNLDFDMLFFFKEELFKDGLEDCTMITSGNMTLSFKFHNVEFVNSLSLFPMALKKLVKGFLHVNDTNWLDDKSNVLELEYETLLNYCRKDVIYLANAIKKIGDYFQDNYNETLSLTIPSMALKIWKNHFLTSKEFIDVKNRSKFFDDDYYFGGHTEKFINEQKVFRNVYYYDVNSLYPSVMKDIKFPLGKLKRTTPSIKKLKQLIKNSSCFYAKITLNVDSEELRFFPQLDEVQKYNQYPFGEIEVKLSEYGINFILEFGDWSNIVEVHDILIGYDDETYNPFTSYVETFYALRKEDKGNDVIFKLLLNSLYGKFGQKTERDVKIINPTKEDKPPKNIVIHEGLHINTYSETVKYYMLDTFRLDVAGKITETARLLMGRYINYIRKHGKVIYTDTDSIITHVNLSNIDSLKHLLSDTQLGLLSDEIGYKDSFICLGQKMYHFYKSGKSATKGVKNMSLDDFRGVIRGSNEFENKRFSRFNALVNRGIHGIQSVPYIMKNIRERLD